MAIAIERRGETVTLLDQRTSEPLDEPMDWIRAQGLAASLTLHADEARRRAFRREGKCVDCGADLEPGSPAETCGPDCPTEAHG